MAVLFVVVVDVEVVVDVVIVDVEVIVVVVDFNLKWLLL